MRSLAITIVALSAVVVLEAACDRARSPAPPAKAPAPPAPGEVVLNVPAMF